jgi:DNA-binding XRE family transcriptional regulator
MESLKERKFWKRIGRELYAARREAGYTQHEFSQQVGLSRASIANIETGRQVVTLYQREVFNGVLENPNKKRRKGKRDMRRVIP